MAAFDPQAHIAILERELQGAHRELQWANATIEKRDAQIRLLEERLRQQRIQVLGPQSETLSNLQLELLAEQEPSATHDEVAAETGREPLQPKPPRESLADANPGRDWPALHHIAAARAFVVRLFLRQSGPRWLRHAVWRRDCLCRGRGR